MLKNSHTLENYSEIPKNITKIETLSKCMKIIILLPLVGLAELASLFFIQTLLPLLATSYNIPVKEVSIILSAEMGLLAVGLLFTGSLADRFGRKRLIVWSLLLGGTLTLLCPLVSSWALLVTLRAMIGLALSGIAAAAIAYITEEVAPAIAGIVTGYFVFGNSLGSMSGRVIASQLMDHIPLSMIFYIFGATLLIVALIVAMALPASRNFKPAADLNIMKLIKTGAQHFTNKKIALLFVISFVIFGAYTSLFNFLAFHLYRPPFNLSYANAGLIPISFALTFFTAPSAGRFSVKYGAMNVLGALLAIMVVGMLITAIANTTIVFIIGVVVFSVAFFASHSVGLSWVGANATQARGQATAFYLFFYYMGGSVLGYVNGFVFVMADWLGLTAFVILLLLIAMLISRFLRKTERLSLAAAPAE